MNIQQTWKNYSEYRTNRGHLVYDLLSSCINVRNKKILDIGCGEGGSATILAEKGAKVFAVDISAKFHTKTQSLYFLYMDGLHLAFENQSFDIVILQDVLEHLHDPYQTLIEAKRVMKDGGVMYICTPNRLSPINFVSDPHWNMPIISILPRNAVKFLIKNVFKIDKRDRSDWAALISYFKLSKIIDSLSLNFEFFNRFVTHYLFRNPKAVVCSPLHLKLIRLAHQMKLVPILKLFVNDRKGLFNVFINPTWYLLVRNKSAQRIRQ